MVYPKLKIVNFLNNIPCKFLCVNFFVEFCEEFALNVSNFLEVIAEIERVKLLFLHKIFAKL